MSQIQGFGLAGIPPSGPLLTLTGDIGPAVTPIGGNINIVGTAESLVRKSVVVDGTVAAGTLNIISAFDVVQTTDAVPVVFPFAVFSLTADTAVVFSANVIGAKDDYTAACGGYVTGIARKDGVNPTVLVGQSPLLSRDPGLSLFGLLLNGDDINVGVQGIAGETWNWTCTYQYQKQVEV